MQSMTPSTEAISNSQIGKIADLLSAGLRKSGLQNKPTQQVIENQGGQLVKGLINVVREFVEAVSNWIIRQVKVDRTKTPKDVIDATDRTQYVDKEVLATMPKGEGDEAEIVFFKLDLSERNGRISDDDLEKEFELRGLKSADGYSLAKVNEDDPAFANTYPNCTHWKDGNGKWSYLAFLQWDDDKRRVYVYRSDSRWAGFWWFAGLRKEVLRAEVPETPQVL